MIDFTLRFPAVLALSLFALSGMKSVFAADEAPAAMVICVNKNAVSPYTAIEVQAGVRNEWPSLNIVPFRTGDETFEQVQDVSVQYPPAQTGLDADSSEAVVKGYDKGALFANSKLVIDFERGRKGTIQSRMISFVQDVVQVGKTVYPATLDLDEDSISVKSSALNDDGVIDMRCVTIENN